MKNYKKAVVYCLGAMTLSFAQAQDNLVPNSSFEDIEKKIKGGGAINMAAPWFSATMNPVDLYTPQSKDMDYFAPENKYGAEKARTGSNYAGIAFYGYRGKRPRTYLQTQLTKPLEAGKEYCVKYFVSLSDKSKYAANNLSAHLSKEEVNEASEANLSLAPHVQSLTNKIFEQQFLWKPICGTYKAEGGEQYLVIGNFKPDEQTLTETIRLSREFSGRQEYDAYYFVDDVSVIPIDKLNEGDCMCDEIAGGKMEVEYKSFNSTPNKEANKQIIYNSDGTVAKKSEGATAEKKVEEKAPEKKAYDVNDVSVFFNKTKSAPKATETAKLEKIVEYMKKNPKTKLEVIGHADESESSVAFLGKRRGLAIQKKLIALGIPAARVTYTSKETSMPHSSAKAEMNQRVTFSLK